MTSLVCDSSWAFPSLQSVCPLIWPLRQSRCCRQQARQKVLVETLQHGSALGPDGWCMRQKATARHKGSAVIRKTRRASPGRRPACERSLQVTVPTKLPSTFTTDTHASCCAAFAARYLPTSQTCRPVTPARDIPTLTLDARVLHTRSPVFDRSPDPAPSTSHSAHRPSPRPVVSFSIYFQHIGHELRQSSAWAHYERARTDQTEHLENSFQPRRGSRADSKYVITCSTPNTMRRFGSLKGSVAPWGASGESRRSLRQQPRRQQRRELASSTTSITHVVRLCTRSNSSSQAPIQRSRQKYPTPPP
jgi:hypothetical protein